METTASVSKGCFVFKNGFKISSSKHKKKNFTKKSLFNQEFANETWYETFISSWRNIEEKLEKLNYTTYSKVLKDLVVYIKGCHNNDSPTFYDETIPSATLLTGINQPDHIIQFTALKDKLKSEVTSHVAVIYSQDSSSVKHMIENMVLQFIQDGNDDVSSSDDDDDIVMKNTSLSLKKSDCNMNVLSAWYQEKYQPEIILKSLSPPNKCRSNQSTNHMVVIIPDFESFNSETLQDFILILSGYTTVLPFVLVFGVATSVSALHKSFPYQVSSRLHVQVFQSHSSSLYLNQILENIFLTDSCPFHLSGKTFKLLIDVFLFYDFSVTGFIQGIKYCMMEHYFHSPIKSLCCQKQLLEPTLNKLSDEDLEAIRHLPSFRPYVESKAPSARVALLINNDYFRIDLLNQLNAFHEYLYNFHVILNVLLGIVSNLPNAPLGKQIRELYAICVSSPIVDQSDFKQCMLIVGFQSKEELTNVLNKAVIFMNDAIQIDSKCHVSSPTKMKVSTPTKKKLKTKHTDGIIKIRNDLSIFIERLESASLDSIKVSPNDEDISLDVTEKLSRQNLKEKLLKASLKDKPSSEFDGIRKELIKYLTEMFETNLKPPNMLVYHELFFFSDVNKVKKHIVGSPRASIHTALNNPSTYLQCKCCELSTHGSLLPTLPDISIVYKLHLECGKLINLYDWLQAFLTIVDPIDDDENDGEERREISPEIQARFTRAVSELQFLGFIKSSKRKTDHVTRLTW